MADSVRSIWDFREPCRNECHILRIGKDLPATASRDHRPWCITSGQQGGLQVGVRREENLAFSTTNVPRQQRRCKHFPRNGAIRLKFQLLKGHHLRYGRFGRTITQGSKSSVFELSPGVGSSFCACGRRGRCRVRLPPRRARKRRREAAVRAEGGRKFMGRRVQARQRQELAGRDRTDRCRGRPRRRAVRKRRRSGCRRR